MNGTVRLGRIMIQWGRKELYLERMNRSRNQSVIAHKTLKSSRFSVNHGVWHEVRGGEGRFRSYEFALNRFLFSDEV